MHVSGDEESIQDFRQCMRDGRHFGVLDVGGKTILNRISKMEFVRVCNRISLVQVGIRGRLL
jgi:hypothetical protein